MRGLGFARPPGSVIKGPGLDFARPVAPVTERSRGDFFSIAYRCPSVVEGLGCARHKSTALGPSRLRSVNKVRYCDAGPRLRSATVDCARPPGSVIKGPGLGHARPVAPVTERSRGDFFSIAYRCPSVVEGLGFARHESASLGEQSPLLRCGASAALGHRVR
jgi:hypothetical protein